MKTRINDPARVAYARARACLAAWAMVLATLVLSLGGPRAHAGETTPAASHETSPPQPKLTERDYLLEELKLVEQQVAQEEKLAESGRGSTDKVLSARRSLLSLRRQLAAYDERTKRPDPADLERRKREAEEQQKAADAQARQVSALKAELVPVLLDIARKDTDARVRYLAVNAVAAQGLESTIEPLSQIILSDTDNEVRVAALRAVAGFRNATGTETLLRLYDALPDPQLKYQAIASLRELEKRPGGGGSPGSSVEVVPVKAMPKLTQIAKEGPTRELRQGAIQQLNAISGEEATTNLIAVYEACVDSEVKQFLVQCLGGRGDAAAARKLVAVAQSDTDPRSRQVAVDLLGRLPSNQQGPIGPRGLLPPLPPRPR